PLICPIHASTAVYKSRPNPLYDRNIPIKINKGITLNEYEPAVENGVVPNCTSAASQPRMKDNPTNPTTKSAIATGTRNINNTSKATIPIIPITSGLIPASPPIENMQ